MRLLESAIACLLSLVALPVAQAVLADSPASGYDGIVSRNVFGLKPIVKEPQAQPPPPVLPKIVLTGVTSILEPKRVLLMLQLPARPPEPAVEKSLILSEGERDGVIEVLHIDVAKGTVRLINSGTEMLLSIEKDGPTASAVPGAPANPQAAAASGRTLLPGVRFPGLDAAVAGRGAAERNLNRIGAGTAPPGLTPPPPPTTAAPTATKAPSLTPEQEAILAELEREANKK